MLTLGEDLDATEEAIASVIREAHQEKKIVFLCDGPPKKFWLMHQMVVFTSPNEGWLRAVRKDHCTLDMPLWTCEELKAAVSALDLRGADGVKISDDVIETRFYIFGGVARECFLSMEIQVKINMDDMMNEVDTVSSPGEDSSDCHRVLHFVPDSSGMMPATKLASPFVVGKLAERMLETDNMHRDKVRKSLECFAPGRAVDAWIFEAGVHDALLRGCTLKLRLLPDEAASKSSDEPMEETIQESLEPDLFEVKKLSAEAATHGPYHKPAKMQFESISAFYLPKMKPGKNLEETTQALIVWNDKHRLILFLMTILEQHPVNASGIIDVLEKLGLLEEVKDKPERVALVFVVPQDIAVDYTRQKIVSEADTVGSVKCIRETTVTELIRREIHTIDEPKAEVEAKSDAGKLIEGKVLENLMSVRDKSCGEAVAKIPQFVCSIPGGVDQAHHKDA